MVDVRSIPSGKVLVTGGSGHVGANLVRRLLAEGQELRCLVQPGQSREAFAGLEVELVEADLRDAAAMRTVVAGCTRLFHVAAKVSTLNASAGEQREIYEVNVVGTRNIMRAALEAGVARAVMTGSFSAVGYDLDRPSAPSNEDLPFYPFAKVLPYAQSKALAELEVLRCVVDGLDAVIVTSCACVGPHDYMPSRVGRTMLDYAHGRLHAYVDGGFPFVAARDIVDGHVLGMEKGRTGHKYIIASEFMTLGDLVEIWSELLGRPPVRLKLPRPVMAAMTGLYSGTFAKLFPNAPQRLNPGALEILKLNRHADTRKAREELGFVPTRVKAALYEALEDFARRGKIPGEMLKPASATPVAAQ